MRTGSSRVAPAQGRTAASQLYRISDMSLRCCCGAFLQPVLQTVRGRTTFVAEWIHRRVDDVVRQWPLRGWASMTWSRLDSWETHKLKMSCRNVIRQRSRFGPGLVSISPVSD